MLKRYLLAGALCVAVACGLLPGAAQSASPRSAAHKLRLSWALIPKAVTYDVFLLDGGDPKTAQQIALYHSISAPGIELDTRTLPKNVRAGYFLARGVDRDGHPVGESPLRPIKAAEMSPKTPLVLDEYAAMAYLPVYPVYAWVPVLHASSYEVEVWREPEKPQGKAERVRHFYTYESVVYDEAGLRLSGHYWWRVRALDGAGRRYSDWSAPTPWTIVTPTPIAALGDSITHGGGAISTPPCHTLYNWETYASVPVKNLGYSGDTTTAMADRFEADVLPFSPRILIVMGGINDFRGGTPAPVTIRALTQIADKCRAHGIVPVFVTATPIHPKRMAESFAIEPAAADWKKKQRQINDWIMAQPHAIDVTAALTDADGNLRADYTADGLHPDDEAKRSIGEAIGRYVTAHFPDLAAAAKK
ncbi:MAG: SGNH/GDSL hydrolase family protein [Schwartzia sp. (in: firmicutes)]